MNTQSNRRERLRHWLAQQNGRLRASEIGDDLPLLQERVINSLQVTDLLLFIEELRGKPVQLEEIQANAFASINTIYATFLQGEKPCA